MVRRATVAALKYTILSESNSVLFRFDVWKNGFKVELGERRTFMIFPDQVQTFMTCSSSFLAEFKFRVCAKDTRSALLDWTTVVYLRPRNKILLRHSY